MYKSLTTQLPGNPTKSVIEEGTRRTLVLRFVWSVSTHTKDTKRKTRANVLDPMTHLRHRKTKPPPPPWRCKRSRTLRRRASPTSTPRSTSGRRTISWGTPASRCSSPIDIKRVLLWCCRETFRFEGKPNQGETVTAVSLFFAHLQLVVYCRSANPVNTNNQRCRNSILSRKQNHPTKHPRPLNTTSCMPSRAHLLHRLSLPSSCASARKSTPVPLSALCVQSTYSSNMRRLHNITVP